MAFGHRLLVATLLLINMFQIFLMETVDSIGQSRATPDAHLTGPGAQGGSGGGDSGFGP